MIKKEVKMTERSICERRDSWQRFDVINQFILSCSAAINRFILRRCLHCHFTSKGGLGQQ